MIYSYIQLDLETTPLFQDKDYHDSLTNVCADIFGEPMERYAKGSFSIRYVTSNPQAHIATLGEICAHLCTQGKLKNFKFTTAQWNPEIHSQLIHPDYGYEGPIDREVQA